MVEENFHRGEVRQNTTVAVPLHRGAVKTPPWWSGNATMVKFLQHRGVFPDFTMVLFQEAAEVLTPKPHRFSPKAEPSPTSCHQTSQPTRRNPLQPPTSHLPLLFTIPSHPEHKKNLPHKAETLCGRHHPLEGGKLFFLLENFSLGFSSGLLILLLVGNDNARKFAQTGAGGNEVSTNHVLFHALEVVSLA